MSRQYGGWRGRLKNSRRNSRRRAPGERRRKTPASGIPLGEGAGGNPASDSGMETEKVSVPESEDSCQEGNFRAGDMAYPAGLEEPSPQKIDARKLKGVSNYGRVAQLGARSSTITRLSST